MQIAIICIYYPNAILVYHDYGHYTWLLDRIFNLRNNTKYKILKTKSAINSPLKSMSKPDDKDKKQMLKKLSFFTVLKKK